MKTNFEKKVIAILKDNRDSMDSIPVWDEKGLECIAKAVKAEVVKRFYVMEDQRKEQGENWYKKYDERAVAHWLTMG